MPEIDEDSDISLLADDRLIGTTLGPYRLDSILGQGGMGVVYRATRVTDFSRTVAIKVVRSDRRRADTLRRFERERAILSRLSHPSIAPLLDGGSTSDGRPYLVMALIEGERIDAYVERWNLGPREIAELLVLLCRAVGYAHERRVLHRDLKPGNVLVTADRHVVVTDFGLAKLAETESDETHTEELFGTLNYLPPERLSQSSERGALEDVWGIGAIFFRLLTGRPPYQLRNLNEAMEVLRSCRAPSVEEFRSDVPAELRFIVGKCLEPDPSDRYATPDEVADELQRFLTAHPLKARPVPNWRRWTYWARRHPRDAALVCSSIAIALVSLAGLTLLWRIAEGRRKAESEARRLAEEQQQVALRHQQRVRSAVDTMFTEVSRAIKTMPYTGEVRERLLAAAADAYEDLAIDVQEEPALRSASGTAYFRLGEIRGWLGDSRGSVAAFRKARDIFAQLLEENPSDREARFDLFHCLLYTLDYQEAIRHIRYLVELDPTHPDYRDCLAAVLKQDALETLDRDLVTAAARAGEAVVLGDQLKEELGLGDFRSLHAATSRAALAKIAFYRGDAAEALRLLEVAEPISRALAEGRPEEYGIAAEHVTVLGMKLGAACLLEDRQRSLAAAEELELVTKRLCELRPDGIAERSLRCHALLESGVARWWFGDDAGAEQDFEQFHQIAQAYDWEQEFGFRENLLFFYACCPIERFRDPARVRQYLAALPEDSPEALKWCHERAFTRRTLAYVYRYLGDQQRADTWRKISLEEHAAATSQSGSQGERLPQGLPFEVFGISRTGENNERIFGSEACLLYGADGSLIELYVLGYLRP